MVVVSFFFYRAVDLRSGNLILLFIGKTQLGIAAPAALLRRGFL